MAEATSLDLNTQKQKRARSQLSCMPCRVGKLKCNRIRDPACDQCIKRNRETACQYVPPPTKSKTSTNVKGRIRQLEGLVKELMEQQEKTSHIVNSELTSHLTPPSDVDDHRPQKRRTNADANVESSFGQLDISGESIAYTGENHWQTILTSLNDIQRDLGEEDGEPEGTHHEEFLAGASSVSRPTISENDHSISSSTPSNYILGYTKRRTRNELIQAVPDKRVCDRLLSSWFNSADPFKLIIHAPTFQEEYKRFQQHQDMPTMWLGLLFAILTLAESFGLRNQEPGSPTAQACIDRVQLYQSLTASAAVLGDYTRSKQYTIECLLLYMVGLRNDRAAMNAWIIMGIIVRLAMRMGYHRDPGHYPKIDAFQAEMRRRVWTMTHMIDVLMSFGLGLPSMVRSVASDTQPPQNLLDRDFSRTTTLLPAARGDNELTPSLYARTKLGIIHIFAEAAELSHATIPPSFETVEQLNAQLETAKESLPLPLQMPEISELVTDPAEQLMCRFNLDLLYLKCKIVLFRRYMLVPLSELSDEEKAKGIGIGRKACIDSARRVLDHHHTIYNAIQTGGQLENMRWYMGSIAVHDFLLAAMVICLELSQQLNRDKMLRVSGGMNCPTRQAMLKALQKSHDIWEHSSQQLYTTLHSDRGCMPGGCDDVDETKKASKAMAAMLAKIKSQETRDPERDTTQPLQPKSKIFDEQPGTYFDNIGLTVNAARDRQSKGGYAGILTVHQWDSVPDGVDLSNLNYDPASTSYDAPGSLTQATGFTPKYMTNSSIEDTGDPMALDWQAWDDQIFDRARVDVDWTQMTDLYAPQVGDPQDSMTANMDAAAQEIMAGVNMTDEELARFEFGLDGQYTPLVRDVDFTPWSITAGRR